MSDKTTVAEASMAHAINDIATLLERGALTPAKAAEWLRHLAAFRGSAMPNETTKKPDLGRIGALADNLRCAAWGVASRMVITPGGDAYEYRGSTSAVEALMVALNELEEFQAGWR